jgi:hypothetical protein
MRLIAWCWICEALHIGCQAGKDKAAVPYRELLLGIELDAQPHVEGFNLLFDSLLTSYTIGEEGQAFI